MPTSWKLTIHKEHDKWKWADLKELKAAQFKSSDNPFTDKQQQPTSDVGIIRVKSQHINKETERLLKPKERVIIRI
jgi:hypothetical protein